jgi:hypothetical protein
MRQDLEIKVESSKIELEKLKLNLCKQLEDAMGKLCNKSIKQKDNETLMKIYREYQLFEIRPLIVNDALVRAEEMIGFFVCPLIKTKEEFARSLIIDLDDINPYDISYYSGNQLLIASYSKNCLCKVSMKKEKVNAIYDSINDQKILSPSSVCASLELDSVFVCVSSGLNETSRKILCFDYGLSKVRF